MQNSAGTQLDYSFTLEYFASNSTKQFVVDSTQARQLIAAFPFALDNWIYSVFGADLAAKQLTVYLSDPANFAEPGAAAVEVFSTAGSTVMPAALFGSVLACSSSS